MKSIKVNLGKRSYSIIVGKGAVGLLGQKVKSLKLGDSAYIVTNPVIKRKFAPLLVKTLKAKKIDTYFKLIPEGERSKSFSYFQGLLEDLACYDKNRKVFVVALGGGVIGDLAGFVASVYKRGIAYLQVPTTLLAQVDSSIGGKTGIDVSRAKNLAGAIYQPRLVLSDPLFLKSLHKKQMVNAMAEIVKYALISDSMLFSYLEKNYKRLINKDPACLEHVVFVTSRIKSKIVEKDEADKKGIRIILNFGHTIGHAIEAASDFSYSHGQAVALGMICACRISQRLGFLDGKVVLRAEKLIKNIGLPRRIKGISLDKIINAYYKDKKFSGKKNRFVLIQGIGRPLVKEEIPLDLVKQVLASI
ncbi:MAG: 3-dehydroquinate synthase [Candidatus Omnitrophica bacterium]|jgi:3-dehydroquinate synthase|nr:3-dehydroquinate synthase [Candidatus Omnitrophota bacterium]